MERCECVFKLAKIVASALKTTSWEASCNWQVIYSRSILRRERKLESCWSYSLKKQVHLQTSGLRFRSGYSSLATRP